MTDNIRDEMTLTHQRILAMCRVGSTESAAARPRGDEMLLAASESPGQAVIVFRRRYGNQPGTRTVILTIDTAPVPEGTAPHHYQLLFDRFAPVPIETKPRDVTPLLDRYARRTGGVVPAPDVILTTVPAGRPERWVTPPPSYRLMSPTYDEIARGDDETWARRMASSMVEFDVALICMYDGASAVIQHNSYTRRVEV